MPTVRPPRRQPRPMRLVRYHVRRAIVRTSEALLRFMVGIDSWIYLAAAGLVGFEGLEVLFGSFLFAPEFVPLILLLLALIWAVRHHGPRSIPLIRRMLRRTRLRDRAHEDRLSDRQADAPASCDLEQRRDATSTD